MGKQLLLPFCVLLIAFSSCKKVNCGCDERTYLNNIIINETTVNYGSNLTKCQKYSDTIRQTDSTYLIERCAIPY